MRLTPTPTLFLTLALNPNPNQELYLLSWEAGTERLLDAARLPASSASRAPSVDRLGREVLSVLAYRLHWIISAQPSALTLAVI